MGLCHDVPCLKATLLLPVACLESARRVQDAKHGCMHVLPMQGLSGRASHPVYSFPVRLSWGCGRLGHWAGAPRLVPAGSNQCCGRCFHQGTTGHRPQAGVCLQGFLLSVCPWGLTVPYCDDTVGSPFHNVSGWGHAVPASRCL